MNERNGKEGAGFSAAADVVSAVGSKAVKRRHDLEVARAVANRLRDVLAPWCERIEIAGSIRRRKASVGDVELVFVPKMQSRVDMFGVEIARASMAGEYLDALVVDGVLRKRRNVNGSAMWGENNRFAVDVLSGVPVDLFATTEACFENYMVCRTGPGDLNTEIAQRARERGYMWHPTGEGFERLADGLQIPVECERDVFAMVGMPWMEPWGRENWRDIWEREVSHD